jgi:hypothetical protein
MLLSIGQVRNIVDLPAPHRMGNRQVKLSAARWIVYARMEVAPRLEKL